jgi:hypothetical protein
MSVSRPVPVTWQGSQRALDRVLCDGMAGNNIKRITSGD